MSVAGLHIAPESATQIWREHPWHQEIADFKLPQKELISLQSAYVTASRHLGSEQAEGGVYTADGSYVSSSRHLRRGKDLTASNPEAVDPPGDVPRQQGRYLYLGWFFNHYGHFILESLARAWAVQEAASMDGYIMHVHAADGRPAAYLLDFFDLLSIPREKLVFARQDMQVDELLLPSQQAVLSRGLSTHMLALYRQLGRRAAQQEKGAGDVGKKLYISRRFLPPDQRGASNEKALEERFLADGYRVVHPQFLRIKTQLAIFSRGTDFAGLEGSGLHNVLFAAAPRRVWMLGAQNHLADAITQVELDRHCHCDTELHLQRVPEFSCLHPRITPYVINSENDKNSCLPDIKTTTYDRFLWLSSLAAQLDRKECPEEARIDVSGQMQEMELRQLDALSVSSGSAEQQLAGLAQDDELSGFVHVEQNIARERIATAIQQMERYLAEYQCHAGFLHRYAEMLAADQRNEQALEVATSALALDAMNPALRMFHADLMMKQGNAENALDTLQSLSKNFPRYFQAKVKLCEALAKASRFEEAAAILGAVIRDSGKHMGLLARLTWYLFQARHYEAAKEAAHEALRHIPDNPFSFVHLSRIHLALDEPEIALEWVERAIKRAPEKRDLHRLQQNIIKRLHE